MKNLAIQELLSLIHDVVNGDGTWKEKRDAVLAEASDNDKTNLEEFIGWFEEAE